MTQLANSADGSKFNYHATPKPVQSRRVESTATKASTSDRADAKAVPDSKYDPTDLDFLDGLDGLDASKRKKFGMAGCCQDVCLKGPWSKTPRQEPLESYDGYNSRFASYAPEVRN